MKSILVTSLLLMISIFSNNLFANEDKPLTVQGRISSHTCFVQTSGKDGVERTLGRILIKGSDSDGRSGVFNFALVTTANGKNTVCADLSELELAQQNSTFTISLIEVATSTMKTWVLTSYQSINGQTIILPVAQ